LSAFHIALVFLNKRLKNTEDRGKNREFDEILKIVLKNI